MTLLDKYPDSKITVTEGLFQILGQRAISTSRGAAIYDPSMLNVKTAVKQDSGESKDELWLGRYTLLANGEKDIAEFHLDLSNLMGDMNEWLEVTTLTDLFEKLVRIKDEIEEEIEVLALRRAFPGRCRLCPI